MLTTGTEEIMQIETTRFGTIEFPNQDVIHFDKGLIGFYDEHDFIVVPHGQSDVIAWLQSTNTAALAFPVVSAHVFSGYPDVDVRANAERAGLSVSEGSQYAMMVILSAPSGHPATVNLLAPLVIDPESRRGAQAILENSRFSARELFVLPTRADHPERDVSQSSAAEAAEPGG